MTDRIGNLVPAPGYYYYNEILPVEILYSTVGLNQKGMTIVGGTGILVAGQAMGRVTASKKWAKYNNSNNDGTEVCRGFLRDSVDATSTSQEYLGNIVVKGSLRNSKLIGVDAGAVTDLNARQDTVLDIFEF